MKLDYSYREIITKISLKFDCSRAMLDDKGMFIGFLSGKDGYEINDKAALLGVEPFGCLIRGQKVKKK